MVKILLAEDDSGSLCLFEAILQRHGYDTLSVRSISGIREMMMHHHFDMALVDVRLADGLALDVIHELTQQHIPVISTSANDDYEPQCRISGSSIFLQKPVTMRTILAAIDALGVSSHASSSRSTLSKKRITWRCAQLV